MLRFLGKDRKAWFHSFKVYSVWMRLVWLTYLEYRFNTIINSLGSLFWAAGTLLTFEIIFRKVKILAGWSWPQMLVLYGVYNLWWGIMVTFFNGGLNINRRVRGGGLDKILLWPGKSFFYASMKFEPELLVHFLLGLVISILAVIKSGVEIKLWSLLLFGILMLNSWLLIFFVSVLFGVTAFWLTENSYLTDMFWLWESLSKYPSEFFAGYKILYLAIYSVLPVVFIAVVPTTVILGKINWPLILAAFSATVVFGFLATKVWQIGLKRYSGVSV